MPIAFEHGAVRKHYRSLGNVLESWEELFDGLFISTDNWKFMPHQQGWGDLLTWVPVPSTPSRSHRLKKLYWGILILTLGFRLCAGSAKLHSAQSVKDIVENYINNYKLNSTHCNHVHISFNKSRRRRLVKLAGFFLPTFRTLRHFHCRPFSVIQHSSSMNWSASVLSTVSSDTEPTIVLAFDSAKYIFNAGENTNRAFLQSRRNWKRTRGLFFTQVGTQRASGLPGEFVVHNERVRIYFTSKWQVYWWALRMPPSLSWTS